MMLAAGLSYADIHKRLQTTAPTISRWKKRFLDERINRLVEVRHPGQKPTVITAKLQTRVLDATRGQIEGRFDTFSVRKLARELKISKDAVHRI